MPAHGFGRVCVPFACSAKQFLEEEEAMFAVRDDMHRLLLNTFPAPIVRAIAAGQTEVAHRYDLVTVLQADLSGFTPLSATKTPEEILGTCRTRYKPHNGSCAPPTSRSLSRVALPPIRSHSRPFESCSCFSCAHSSDVGLVCGIRRPRRGA